MESTRSLIEVCNSVLLAVGERPITSTNTTLGSRVKDSLREAAVDIGALNDWTWLQDLVYAESWLLGIATLSSTVQRVKDVFFYRNRGTVPDNYDHPKIPLKYLSEEEFEIIYPQSYDEDNPTEPKYWTIVGWNEVKINPYPSDSTEQANISFRVVKTFNLPSGDNDKFDCPDIFVELLQKKACATFVVRHLGDMNISAVFNNEYEQLALSLRSRNRAVPASGYTMYRGGRVG